MTIGSEGIYANIYFASCPDRFVAQILIIYIQKNHIKKCYLE